MDTIAMHAAGFSNAVATLGTAITPEHARLVSRYTKRVIINYDSDEAGQKAADKAMRLLDEVGLPVRVLKLSGAKDADEYLKLYGADAFRSMMESSHTAFDFKMDKILSKYDISMAEGKIRAARELTALIAETYSGVERELYLRTASERLGISVESLANDVARARARRIREAKKKESRDLQLSARSFGDRVNPDAARNPTAAAAEEVVLGLMLLYPEHRQAVVAGDVHLKPEDFFTDLGRRAFTMIADMERGQDGFSFSALGASLSPDEMGRLVRLQQDRQALQNNGKEVLLAATAVLIKERERREAKDAGDWQSDLLRRRTELKKRKENGTK